MIKHLSEGVKFSIVFSTCGNFVDMHVGLLMGFLSAIIWMTSKDASFHVFPESKWYQLLLT